MIRFEFGATNLKTRRQGTLVVDIHTPRPVEGYPGNYECQIHISGVVDKEMRGVGAFPFQSIDLSLQITKAVLLSHQCDWELSFGQQGLVTFDY
jgi:hypothetical protein